MKKNNKRKKITGKLRVKKGKKKAKNVKIKTNTKKKKVSRPVPKRAKTRKIKKSVKRTKSILKKSFSVKRKPKAESRRKHQRVSVKRSGGKYKSEGGSIFEMLFGGMPKVRLINLFFRNEAVSFLATELAERTKLDTGIINKECSALVGAGILVRHGSGSARSYKLNLSFPFLAEFRNLVQRSFPVEKNKLINIVKRSSKLRLVLVSGLFLNRSDSSVDLFVVGDGLSEKRLESAIKEIEALIGKELRWAGMETQEFLYRWRMFDRFVHDLLSTPHEKIFINKLNLV